MFIKISILEQASNLRRQYVCDRQPSETGNSKYLIQNSLCTFDNRSGKRRPPGDEPGDFFMPENVVPKVRVELTQGHLYRFLSPLPG